MRAARLLVDRRAARRRRRGAGLAGSIEQLIALGHPPDVVWGYTPRQASAYLRLAQIRREHEAAERLAIAALAARGNSEDLQRQIGEWSR
jgi:hypothetical protein